MPVPLLLAVSLVSGAPQPAEPELTDKEKTGGTGMLPEPDEGNVEGPSG